MKTKSKKNIVKLIVLSLCITLIVSCQNNIKLRIQDTGNTKVKLFVPNYLKIAEKQTEARVIAPQTECVQFSYICENEEILLEKIALSEVTATKVENAQEGPFGNTYEIVFSGIYVGIYPANTMTVSLLDKDGNVISKGSNTKEIVVSKDAEVNASFFTIPVSSDAKSSSLAFGEMKFLKQQIKANESYILTVNVEDNQFPDVVIFNADGTYSKYYSVDSAEDAKIEFSKVTEDKEIYIGIFADDADVSSYKIKFDIPVTNENFSEVGFGKNGSLDIAFETDGTTSSTPLPVMEFYKDDVDDDGYAVYFDFKSLETDKSSLKRTITVTEDSLLSFFVKTDIYLEYDGKLKFYIDGKEQDSFDGVNGSWTKVSYILSNGTHEIEWCAEGKICVFTDGITNSVYLDNLTISKLEYLSSFTQDFNGVLSNLWIGRGVSASVIDEDPITSEWFQYGDAIVDSHGKVYELLTADKESSGESTLKIINIKTTVDSALSFDYKLDLFDSNNFEVYIDNEKKFTTTGSGQCWRNHSITIPSGNHVVEFKAISTDGYYFTCLKNAVYLDNINLVPDVTDSVGIYPKGKQETFVNGNPIQFTANALRSDKSVRAGREVTWTCTGGTITEGGVFTPGATAGTYTVTATVDGLSVSNTTVVVHGENYLEDSVTINGTTFTGYRGTTGPSKTSTVNFEIAPESSSFSADGFFVLKGSVNNTNANNYALVQITSGSFETSILLKDDFYTRVWLRFGNTNSYKVEVWDLASISLSGECYTGCYGYVEKTWTVTNTSDIEDAEYLMPSYFCQGDDFLVSNTVNAVLAELPQNATEGQKLQALHDWQIHTLHYDNVSLNNNKRKLQDAVSVLKNKMAVCEGYANLYACFARAIGVKTKYQASSQMCHGWLQCYYNGAWRLVDVTWDDPVANYSDSNTEKNPYAENYAYFLIANTGINNDHYGDETDTGRSAVSVQPIRFFGPNGWY